MYAKEISKQLSLFRFFKYCEEHKGVYDGKQIGNELHRRGRTYSEFYSWLEPNEAIPKYIDDVNSAKGEICIDIPGKVGCNQEELLKIVAALQQAEIRGVRVSVRVEKKETIPKEMLRFAKENRFVCNPISIIDHRIV